MNVRESMREQKKVRVFLVWVYFAAWKPRLCRVFIETQDLAASEKFESSLKRGMRVK